MGIWLDFCVLCIDFWKCIVIMVEEVNKKYWIEIGCLLIDNNDVCKLLCYLEKIVKIWYMWENFISIGVWVYIVIECIRDGRDGERDGVVFGMIFGD